jgi:hypothetical protein
MAAVKFPAASTFTFGTTAQTGLAVESFEQNDTTDVYEQKNEVGEVIEVVTYNPRSECTLSGEFNAALTAILGKSYTVANLINVQVPTGGISIVKSVNTSFGRAKNAAVKIMSTYYPLVVA